MDKVVYSGSSTVSLNESYLKEVNSQISLDLDTIKVFILKQKTSEFFDGKTELESTDVALTSCLMRFSVVVKEHFRESNFFKELETEAYYLVTLKQLLNNENEGTTSLTISAEDNIFFELFDVDISYVKKTITDFLLSTKLA